MALFNDQTLQGAATRLLVSLRQGRGIDVRAVADLKAALQNAAEAWASSDTIPKSAANLFVDLVSGIEGCSYVYAGREAEDIVKLADEIAELIRACVAVNGI